MAVISLIEKAAKAVGITATVTNSDAKIQTQLNRLKDEADDAMALISWDLTTNLEFDLNGFLKNPTTPVVMLLMSKADSSEKEDREKTAEKMGGLFTQFIIKLRGDLVQFNIGQSSETLLTGIQYQIVPKYGIGQHSGVIGRFTMSSGFNNC